MHYFSDFCSCNNLIYSVMMQHNTDTRFPFIHAHISKFFVSNIKFWLSFTCIWLPMKWFSPFSVRWLCVSSVDYSEHTNELPISLALSCSRADSQPYKWLATPVRNREKKNIKQFEHVVRQLKYLLSSGTEQCKMLWFFFQSWCSDSCMSVAPGRPSKCFQTWIYRTAARWSECY